MELKKIIESKKYLIIAVSLGMISILILVFGAGMAVGYRKARFSYQWGENYHRNFGGPEKGFFMMSMSGQRDLINSNGVAGQIIKINISNSTNQVSTLVVKGNDNNEKVISVNAQTVIRKYMEDIKISDLKTDDFIVAIGEPNDAGQIEAKLVRVMMMPDANGSVPAAPIPPMPSKHLPFNPF